MLPTSSTSKPVPAWAQAVEGKQSAIDRLFARLSAMYMQRWRANFPSQDFIDAWSETWAEALSRHRIQPQQAFAALQALEQRGIAHVPTLPEFLLLCRPTQMDYRQAHAHAVRNLELRAGGGGDEWPELAIYWAAQDIGPYELRTLSYGQIESTWRRCLDRRREGSCPDIPALMPVLAPPPLNQDGKVMTLAEAMEEAKAAINRLTGLTPSSEAALARARRFASDEAGGKVSVAQSEWARRVIARLGHIDQAT